MLQLPLASAAVGVAANVVRLGLTLMLLLLS